MRRDSSDHRHGHKDATWEEVLHNIQNAGIRLAAPEFECVDDEARDELGRLHRRWAAVKIGITRG